MKGILFILPVLLSKLCFSQDISFSVSSLPSMPEPVANNAVTSAYSGDTLCVYSFCGIDSTKTPAGIHLKAWRYNTVSEVWSQLPDVPDATGNGKIAAGASTVDNKIYLIGGYYVADNFSEESSNDVHVFNPETNSWEADGAPIPVPIDDHVQAVWNGTHIYVITGWSDNQNVANVQIYTPVNDLWLEGTSTPDNSDYKVFGGSGDILGNTIYYHGGVRSSFGFFPTAEVRKGVINPENPLEIEWEILGDSELGTTYRAAAISIPTANSVYWFGGSQLGYNFDGIDYNGTGPVAPLGIIKAHNIFTEEVINQAPLNNQTFFELSMDLRGIARLTSVQSEEENGEFSAVICGGMHGGAEVNNRVFKISSDNVVHVQEQNEDEWFKFRIDVNQLNYASKRSMSKLTLIDIFGREINQFNPVKEGSINLSELNKGVYFLSSISHDNERVCVKLKI